MWVIDLGLQGHLTIIVTQETAFNVALVYYLGRPRGAARPKRALVYTWNKIDPTEYIK